MNAFEKHEYLSARKEHFQLSIPTIAPRRGKAVGYDINQLSWNEVKFLKDDGTLHDDMSTIPNDTGGIYIFRIKSDLIPNVINYTMYIGRAQYNNGTYSLRSRCRRYITDTRLSIQKMINYWGPYLYISYTTIDDNELIVDLEKFLIASVLPVYNPEIDEVEIKEAKRMFYP
ncbi:hypothetical protein [Bacillus kexueae]|uniref:hypothetical protein n=1 Tax=Aeribacillus kexueae TaxID=2078952 RepID=UPI001FAF7ACB|nr:hypothetical protein [Bacillus kexueae]